MARNMDSASTAVQASRADYSVIYVVGNVFTGLVASGVKAKKAQNIAKGCRSLLKILSVEAKVMVMAPGFMQTLQELPESPST